MTGAELVFEITRINTSTWEIEGVAHVETVDKDKETILIKAIEDSLPDFMELPILTVDHLERPVGLITKAWIEDLRFHLTARVKSTADCADIRNRIQKALDNTAIGLPPAPDDLNSFSIKGLRTEYSPECLVPVGARTSPCVTKAIHLWAVTLCGGNARNPLAYFDVVKAFPPVAVATVPPPTSVKMTPPETGSKSACPLRKHMPDTPTTPPGPGSVAPTEPLAASPEPVQKAEPAVTPAAVDFAGIFAKALQDQMPELARVQATAQATTLASFAKAQDEKFDQKIAEITKAMTDTYEERLARVEGQKVRLGPLAFMKADGKAVELSGIEDGNLSNILMIKKAKEA